MQMCPLNLKFENVLPELSQQYTHRQRGKAHNIFVFPRE